MSKKIKYVCLHCTATPEGVYKDKFDIERIHIKEKGWSKLGYHKLFLLNGQVQVLHPHDGDNFLDITERSNGCWGINQYALHWSYVGGVEVDGKTPKDTRTFEQRESLESEIKKYILKFPGIKFLGHNQAIHPTRSPKACPSFFVPEWLEHIGVDSKNIEYARNIFTKS